MAESQLEITVHVIPNREMLPQERRRVEKQLRWMLGRTGVFWQLWFYPHSEFLPDLGPPPQDRVTIPV